jgi:hypothetical protein
MSPSLAKLKAEVRKTAAGPELFVNGKATAPTMFFVNLDSEQVNRPVQFEELQTARKHGVNLISIPIGMPWPKEGEPTSDAYDKQIDDTLKANPDGLLLLRVGVTWPYQWWLDKHPEELTLYDDGKRQTTSVHSPIWRADAARCLELFVAHLEAKYGDHIFGYMPTGHNTGEWFYDRSWDGRLGGFEIPARDGFQRYLKAKYGSDETLRSAWHDPDITFDAVEVPTLRERTHSKAGAFRDPLVEQKTIDFFEFQNEDMVEAVELMCKAIKTAAPDKLAVPFFGYHFELGTLPYGPQMGGHLALRRLLKSPYVDVVCSPVSYGDRDAGGIGAFMSAVDSVQLAGKLWLNEDDTRTHLGGADATYGMSRAKNAAESEGILARNFAHILTRGSATWWMDLFGHGWFTGDEMWKFLSGLQGTYQNAIPKMKPYRAEIAVIVDDRSCLYTAPSRIVTGPLIYAFRMEWYRIGAPVGIYMLDDLVAGKVPPAKMYIFIDTFRLDKAQIEAVRKNACRNGCTVVWMYAPGVIRDSRFSSDYVQDVTKIALKQTASGDGEIVLDGGGKFSAGHPHLSPAFAVNDPKAVPLAHYEKDGEVAIASKNEGGWTSVYCGALQMPRELLTDLARHAGVHIYSDQNDVVMAGNGFVAIHASSNGRKTLTMPGDCELVDVTTGEKLPRGRRFEFDMKKGNTRILMAR